MIGVETEKAMAADEDECFRIFFFTHSRSSMRTLDAREAIGHPGGGSYSRLGAGWSKAPMALGHWRKAGDGEAKSFERRKRRKRRRRGEGERVAATFLILDHSVERISKPSVERERRAYARATIFFWSTNFKSSVRNALLLFPLY